MKNIGSGSFEGKTEVNGIDEVAHQGDDIESVVENIGNYLISTAIPEFKRNDIHQDKGCVEDQQRRKVKAQPDHEDPERFSKRQTGKISQVDQVKKDAG